MSDIELTAEKFKELAEVMHRLRAPGGCPWDKEQDYMSLRRYILEEAYELIEAIESEDTRAICEECGDLMLQPVFISCIAEERGDFGLTDAIESLVAKLIRRHPHVFGDARVNNSGEVLKKWEQIKASERKDRKENASMLAGIPRALPALLRAHRMQERAAKIGFDWPCGSLDPVLDKVKEEMTELNDALCAKEKKERVEEELGDTLFALVNLSRHMEADAETVLHRACEKFASRFAFIESQIAQSGRPHSDFTLDDMESFWRAAKENENESKIESK